MLMIAVSLFVAITASTASAQPKAEPSPWKQGISDTQRAAALVLDAFDWQLLRTEIQSTVTRCNAGSWLETVDRLQRFYRVTREQ